MAEMKIEQTLTEEDIKRAYSVHYSSYNTWTRYRPASGVALIGLGVSMYYQSSMNNAFAVFAMLYGGYMIFAKHIYIFKCLKSIKTDKYFGYPLTIELTKDGMITTVRGNENSRSEIKSMYGFRTNSDGVLIYRQRSLFFPLKHDAIESAGGIDLLFQILDENGVKRLK